MSDKTSLADFREKGVDADQLGGLIALNEGWNAKSLRRDLVVNQKAMESGHYVRATADEVDMAKASGLIYEVDGVPVPVDRCYREGPHEIHFDDFVGFDWNAMPGEASLDFARGLSLDARPA